MRCFVEQSLRLLQPTRQRVPPFTDPEAQIQFAVSVVQTHKNSDDTHTHTHTPYGIISQFALVKTASLLFKRLTFRLRSINTQIKVIYRLHLSIRRQNIKYNPHDPATSRSHDRMLRSLQCRQ